MRTYNVLGVPKEIKPQEGRVGLRPIDVKHLKKKYSTSILVESGAGILSGYSDISYAEAGATVVNSSKELYSKSNIIIKVKEPIGDELQYLNDFSKTFFCYFHFASTGINNINGNLLPYEEVVENGRLPLLEPMSEIAGKLGAHKGSELLMNNGLLIGGATGVSPANVLVLGGGVVGYNSAKVALGMGANVTILDRNINRLRELDYLLPNSKNLYSDDNSISVCLSKADLVIGAVHSKGKKTDCLVTENHFDLMKNKSVFIDVAIDQGGCTAVSKPTSHSDPTFIHKGVTMYCVANMPGLTPRTSTDALCNSTIRFTSKLIEFGNINNYFTS